MINVSDMLIMQCIDTLAERFNFFLRWQLVFHDPETDQLQKKNKLLHKLCVTELETSSV